MNYFKISIFQCLYVITIIISSQFWGYLSDKFGHISIQKICRIGIAILSLGYVLTSPEFYLPLLIFIFLCWGFFDSGAQITDTHLLLNLSPKENKSIFIAHFSSITGIAAAIASLVGGVILQHTTMFNFSLFGHKIINYHLLFILSAILKFFSTLTLKNIQCSEEKSPGYIVSRMFNINPFKNFTGLYTFLHTEDENKKVKAIERLGETKSKLATYELIEALYDPSLEIREETAQTLGKIGDKEAVEPLMQKLESIEHGIQEEAAEALGQIKDRRSVNILIKVLNHPDKQVRISVAKALGEISDKSAVEPLLDLLGKEKDINVIVALAYALSKIGDIKTIYSILPIMRKTSLPLFKWQLAIIIANLLGNEGEFYVLLNKERKQWGEGVEKVFSELSENMIKLRCDIWAPLLHRVKYYYLQKNWFQQIKYANELGDKFIRFILEDFKKNLLKELEDKLDKLSFEEIIKKILTTNLKLGINLWYLNTTFKGTIQPNKICFEEALLTIYALKQIIRKW